MASFKTSRTEEDILRELTAIFRTLKDPRIDPMLTVVRVELASDLSYCKVYVSSLSGLETAKESCRGLDSASGFIRREILHRLKIRRAPQFQFIADDSIAYGSHISQKLKDIQPHVAESDVALDSDGEKSVTA